MGCRRAGWYSYDRLDNAGVPSARELLPGLQELRVGDVLPATPEGDDGFVVQRLEPPRVLVLGGLYDLERKRQVRAGEPRPEQFWEVSWAFVLEPLDARTTRLLVRGRVDFAPERVQRRALWMGAV